uniref:bifunctional 4-hydroxy-2-oxoglutarate aldolase/2-dehydro-3-deoxy-phosphogluconate aldolase n=1 Tax=Ndongobacter massiliensis TaxID=1871025 RepID=UPI000930BAF7|nr:bifunctional 4-hydroxy-2-oxoglutarate aldolase/2-dehydro-3-deoxy-phosphogluconate aldolase [Ndongobacter massiliensis]
MNKENVLNNIKVNKVLTICRGVYGDALYDLAKALYLGGIRMMEVTFDQGDPEAVTKTSTAIKQIREQYDDMMVGSGTCLTIEQVHATKEAGGLFVLSPNVDKEIIMETKRLGMVSIPGAMTPTEVLQAHTYGADLVKIFPAAWLGLSYLKDLKGPINNVDFLATAGVNEENFADFLSAGYVGAGISSRLVDKKLIAAKDFAELTRRAKVFTKIAKAYN